MENEGCEGVDMLDGELVMDRKDREAGMRSASDDQDMRGQVWD